MGYARPSLSELMSDYEQRFHYCNPLLGEVVTLPEAIELWKKTKVTVVRACERFRLESRTTITGGTTMITVASLKRLWGEPVLSTLTDLRSIDNANGQENNTGGHHPYRGVGRTYHATRAKRRQSALSIYEPNGSANSSGD